MITGDQAIALLIEANPVPDISTLDLSGDALTAHLADLDPRSSEMTTTKPDRSDTRPASGPRRLVGIAAGVAALVVAGVFLARMTADPPPADQATTLVETGPGLLGLPPKGATPSTPENGVLLASMYEHRFAPGPGSFGNGWLYLYADGRLIWQRWDPDPTGGILEQRLTPEGVELIRDEIISTGWFDPDQPPPPPPAEEPTRCRVEVRNEDRLVKVENAYELCVRLAELWTWLPNEAWQDNEIRGYVPSRYAVCQDMIGASPARAQEQLSQLPPAAQDLLAGAPTLRMDSNEFCFEISTAEARSLGMILDEALGVTEEGSDDPFDVSGVNYVISTGLEQNGQPGLDEFWLALWPILPHGAPAIAGGG